MSISLYGLIKSPIQVTLGVGRKLLLFSELLKSVLIVDRNTFKLNKDEVTT